MIGSGLKKLANDRKLKIANGVVYGYISGFMTTLDEGIGFKRICISFSAPNAETILAIQKSLSDTKLLNKQYRLQDIGLQDNYMVLGFFDNPGTMKCINSFIDWYYPELKETGALGSGYCSQCNQELLESDTTYKLINGIAFCMHRHCVTDIQHEFKLDKEETKDESAYIFRGTVGALLGGIIGSIPWAILYALGWFVGWLGLLIGFTAKKGYTLLGGKIKRVSIPILLFVVIVSVLFAQLLGDVFSLGYMILNGEIEGTKLSDIPLIFTQSLFLNSEYLAEFFKNVVIGLVFAVIGAYSIFREIHAETADNKIIDLE